METLFKYFFERNFVMTSSILINKQNLSVKNYKGQRVVTFKDIDLVHNRVDGTARRNFNTNKKRFIKDVDYFKIQPNEIRTVGITSPNGGIVITESGYLILVKSFTDDLSWTVQRELVNSYFREKQREATNTQLSKPTSGYQYIDKTFLQRPILTIADICYFYNVNYFYLYAIICKELSHETDYILLQGNNLKQYLNENPNAPKSRRSLYIIYKSGFNKLLKHFNFEVEEVPKIMFQKNPQNFVVQEEVRHIMDFIRRDLKGIEALTYLVESIDTPENLDNYRDILVKRLAMLGRWKMNTSLVKLGIHEVSAHKVLEA